jgi:hypothetical protein
MPPIKKKVAEIITLKMIKIIVNPQIKQRDVIKRIKRFLLPGSFSADDTAIPAVPPKIPRYEGIKGNTQGEKKESSPAANVRNIDG